MIRAIAILLLMPALAGAQSDGWDVGWYDPGYETGAADLLLPMPCGGAMAFQKVDVPLDRSDPLADRRLRLGQSGGSAGYSDDLRTAFLRGPFGEGDKSSHFYIARYELTQRQFRALQGSCAEPSRSDRTARGGLSWYDAITLAQNFTAWLYANAPGSLPVADGKKGYLRLPTETEWEYAARGGAKVEPARFSEFRFFDDGELRDYAYFQGGGARGRLGPVGLRRPNPLGLYDVYGNAEELMLEPYRMNVVGRAHGQAGGVVTRGGSVLSTGDQIYSAQRTEYPYFNPDSGRPLRGDTFGIRLVIGLHVATSEGRLKDIRAHWDERTGGSPDGPPDPERTLAALIEAETAPDRLEALSALQLELKRNRARATAALDQSTRATFLAGAVFVESLDANALDIERRAAGIRQLVELQRAGESSAILDRQLNVHVDRLNSLRQQQRLTLLSYREALEALTGEVDPEDRDRVQAVLHQELGLSGQVRLKAALDRFGSDLTQYGARPDMSIDALLRLALN